MKTRMHCCQVLAGALLLSVVCSTAYAETPLRISVGASDFLKDDSLGDYFHGVDYVRAGLADPGWLGFGPYFPPKGRPAPIRRLYLDLNYPVPGGGGTPKGIVGSNPASEHLHVCTPDGTPVVDIPPGTTVVGGYGEATFLINSASHKLIFGNGCHEILPSAGTSTFTITRNLDGSWTFFLPEGSVGALWKSKGRGYVLVGTYFFGAALNAQAQ